MIGGNWRTDWGAIIAMRTVKDELTVTYYLSVFGGGGGVGVALESGLEVSAGGVVPELFSDEDDSDFEEPVLVEDPVFL